LIFGLGTDIIEVEKVELKMSKTGGLREKIFTQKEIEYCESKFHKGQHYAARFAVKEAFFKALGTGWRHGMAFCEIEILNDDLGKPEITLHGKAKEFTENSAISHTHVSLSHIKNIVNAVVILEK
jgi:holo-[acyl-carrier protein] synthase